MFSIYITRLKILLKQKSNLFWVLFFPIILSCFFYVALRSAYSEDLNTMPVAIVDETNNSTEFSYFKNMMEEINLSDNKNMFDITYTDADEAKDLLDKSEVVSYIVFDGDLQMYVNNSDVEQSIIKSVLESFKKVSNSIVNLAVLNGGNISDINIEKLYQNDDYIFESSIMEAKPSVVLNHFYSLIAMACLFSSMYGLREITDIQANLSSKGMRLNITPTHKYKLILSSIFAAFTIQIVSNIILILFLAKVLNIDFGERTLLVMLTCIVSSLTALFFGTAVGAMSKKSLDFKSGILNGITMFGCFLSGLMVVNLKFYIAKFIPFMQYINPANLITDALYSLYYYASLNRYLLNISLLMVFAVIFAIITYFMARRSQYASL